MKVKIIPRSNFKCLIFYQGAGGDALTEKHSRETLYSVEF